MAKSSGGTRNSRPERNWYKESQDVRKYLNDPDLMFRRFRYKAGEEIEYDDYGNEIGKKIIWGKKWKKRIKNPDGTYRWIDYDKASYKDDFTGKGYYKSSAKNAMRVARTETNIAYRRADNARWQEMDFVLGQRIQLSKDHPKKDICNKLAGDYPKEFLFDGWHPQCFCYVTPITLPPEETKHLTEMMLNGEDWRSELKRLKRGREITSYPENFKQWVRDNAENIAAARERGTLPYFISNNQRAIDKILNPDAEPLSIEERAAQRHAERDDEDIRRRWAERNERIIKQSQQNIITKLTIEAARYEPNNALVDAYIKSMRECRINGDIDGFNAEHAKLVRFIETLRKQYTSELQFSSEQITQFAKMEKSLKIKRGIPMTLSEADEQKANPDYAKGREYKINCQTCAPAYVLRSQGFDVTASANISGSVNEWISRGHSFEIWENSDGTAAKPILFRDWLNSKGYKNMSPKRYKSFYEEATKEPGIYITTIAWKGGGAHATIIQRFADGTLSYIEPQYYSGSMKRDIMELCNDGKTNIPSYSIRGIMRVDDKILKQKCSHFGTDYDIWSIFRTK